MGRKVEPRKRIVQKSIGFEFRQLEFFNKYPDFKPDGFCRQEVDNQIAVIDPMFLNEDDPRKVEEEQEELWFEKRVDMQ